VIIHLRLPLPTAWCGLPADIERAARLHRPFGPLDLAPGGVYQATWVTPCAGGLLHHRFTLTRITPGGLFSVALSRGLPRVGVTHHLALRSPDFPRRDCSRRDHPANSSAHTVRDRQAVVDYLSLNVLLVWSVIPGKVTLAVLKTLAPLTVLGFERVTFTWYR
jgi:hypothetical protein